MLLSPSQIPYHITVVITNLKKKNPASQKNNSFCSTSTTDDLKKFPFSFSLTNGFSAKGGFFHEEIESPERVTILVIILSGCSHTSRIIADSVKNSIEFLSQKWGFIGFCLNTH